MPNLMSASSIDSPLLSNDQAKNMPEFVEGAKAKSKGANMIDNPYSIFKVSESEKRIIPSLEWRQQYENRFQAWNYGYRKL